MESFSNDIHAILRELNQSEHQADEIISVVEIVDFQYLLCIFQKYSIDQIYTYTHSGPIVNRMDFDSCRFWCFLRYWYAYNISKWKTGILTLLYIIKLHINLNCRTNPNGMHMKNAYLITMFQCGLCWNVISIDCTLNAWLCAQPVNQFNLFSQFHRVFKKDLTMLFRSMLYRKTHQSSRAKRKPKVEWKKLIAMVRIIHIFPNEHTEH